METRQGMQPDSCPALGSGPLWNPSESPPCAFMLQIPGLCPISPPSTILQPQLVLSTTTKHLPCTVKHLLGEQMHEMDLSTPRSHPNKTESTHFLKGRNSSVAPKQNSLLEHLQVQAAPSSWEVTFTTDPDIGTTGNVIGSGMEGEKCWRQILVQMFNFKWGKHLHGSKFPNAAEGVDQSFSLSLSQSPHHSHHPLGGPTFIYFLGVLLILL